MCRIVGEKVWSVETHSVDAGQLLGQLQDYGDNNGLSVGGVTEQLRNRNLLLHGHLQGLFLHLMNVILHI